MTQGVLPLWYAEGKNPAGMAALRADLDFHGSNSSYGSHAWHPFPAKFPPQLPEFLISQLSSPNDVVFDPMLGSGTTLVEAVRLGRRTVGCDIDLLARMIATAKLTTIDPSTALQTGRSVLKAAWNDYREDGARLRRDCELRFDAKTAEFIDYWFLPQQQLELLAILQRIEALPKGGTGEFLRVVFFRPSSPSRAESHWRGTLRTRAPTGTPRRRRPQRSWSLGNGWSAMWPLSARAGRMTAASPLL